jgi:transcriptional regulator with XRE-family HTH domain
MRVEAILARNLKRLRNLRGLSQEALADEAGLNRTYLGLVENAKNSISIGRLAKLAKPLGVKPRDLIDDEYEP